MGLTITEKILARASGKKLVVPGEILNIKADVTVINDHSLYPGIIEMLNNIGIDQIPEVDKLVIGIDHRIPANNIQYAEKHKLIRQFVQKQGIKHFYDVGRSGINHQIMAEKGFARPGIVYACDDFHATTLGAFGCYASSYGLGVIQSIVSGEIWVRVPASIRINVKGNFPLGVGSRDLIHYIIGELGLEKALFKAVEFTGPIIDAMSIDSRMTMCNMIAHCETTNGIMNPDLKTIEYVKARANMPFDVLCSDTDANYESQLDIDVSNFEPIVSIPHEPFNTRRIGEVEGLRVDQAFVGSCASGRLEDLEIIAKILKGRKVHPKVRMIVIPPSYEIASEMLKRGLMEVFLKSDCVVCNPNCGPCAGGHMGVLGSSEVCITSSSINSQGRMGSKDAEIYLSSPATVAASAIEGKITDPRKYLA